MQKAMMAGKTFGNLTVLEYAEKAKGHHKWKCVCTCGNEATVDGGNLRSGHTKSCGHCARYERLDHKTMICRYPDGRSFLFDSEDYPLIAAHKWSIEDSGYIHSMLGGRHIRLHNLLLGVPNMVVDHINGDRTDNRRCNLRLCTNKENVRNARVASHNTTGYKGVSYNKRRKKYESRITVDGRQLFLGYFINPIEAALAYDRAALRYFGEYARPNFMKEAFYESEVLAVG